jgi:ferric-dicitrate binding protein FerR (iron transport regulator)
MGKTNLDHLLKRYLNGQVSEAERIKIEAWLDVMKTEGDLNLDKDDEERLFQTITSNVENVNEVIAFRPQRSNAKNFYSHYGLKLAAAVFLLLVVAYAIWYADSFQLEEFKITATNKVKKAILTDGTIVWLYKDGALSFSERDGKRYASLIGEAFFEVAKSPGSPFIIECGDLTVKVLGTSFNLRTNKESVELSLLTGKVNLSTTADKNGIDVTPNERVIYTVEGRATKNKLSPADIGLITANIEYEMQFKNTTMAEVVRKIQNKFEVMIKVEDSRLMKCRITADFTDQSLEATLRMISELIEIKYEIAGKNISIKGNGCNEI